MVPFNSLKEDPGYEETFIRARNPFNGIARLWTGTNSQPNSNCHNN
jgi:hypothetical protein